MKYAERVYTSLNIGQELYDRVVALAGTTGDSINGTLVTLVHLGLKLMDADQLSVSSSTGSATGPCSAS